MIEQHQTILKAYGAFDRVNGAMPRGKRPFDLVAVEAAPATCKDGAGGTLAFSTGEWLTGANEAWPDICLECARFPAFFATATARRYLSIGMQM